MELLKLVNEMQTEEYALRLRRESLKNICGYELTDFQIGALMCNNVNNSQTIYAAQQRQAGTSTALLLKVYQSIFLENRLNDKYIMSMGNQASMLMKNQMIQLLGQAHLLNQVRRDSRYRIELANGCTIHFENNNPLNLRGIGTGPEFFFDDYVITNEAKNQEMSANIRPTYPTHIHYFLASDELSQEFTSLLFN